MKLGSRTRKLMAGFVAGTLAITGTVVAAAPAQAATCAAPSEITTPDGYTVVTFGGAGATGCDGFWTVPAEVTEVDILAGAGGGGGASVTGQDFLNGSGGGGGAGEVLLEEAVTVTEGETLSFDLGNGGPGASFNQNGSNGSPTTISGAGLNISLAGGGGGGRYGQAGNSGGSGGGGGANMSSTVNPGGEAGAIAGGGMPSRVAVVSSLSATSWSRPQY